MAIEADVKELFSKSARKAAGMILSALVPPSCLVCRDPIAADGAICSNCWPEFSFISEPLCPVTGAPFSFDLGDGTLSAEAIANPPDFDRARAALLYNRAAQNLVSRLKFSDDLALAKWMAHWMGRAGQDFLLDADRILPVPLHARRLFSRRYNQSAELARHLATYNDVTFDASSLVRVKSTPSQIGLSRKERKKNVSGAFKVSKEHKINIDGRKLLLVDDVLTTGATVNACARALRKAGAARVDVLTFARVPAGGFDMAL